MCHFPQEVEKARKSQEDVLQKLRAKSELDRKEHLKEVDRLEVGDTMKRREK